MPKIDTSGWDDEARDWLVSISEREYESFTVAAAIVPESGYGDYPLATSITLHIDEETGVVVHDVAKYERNLR